MIKAKGGQIFERDRDTSREIQRTTGRERREERDKATPTVGDSTLTLIGAIAVRRDIFDTDERTEVCTNSLEGTYYRNCLAISQNLHPTETTDIEFNIRYFKYSSIAYILDKAMIGYCGVSSADNLPKFAEFNLINYVSNQPIGPNQLT